MAPEQLIAFSELATFKKMVAAKTPSLNRRKRVLEVLKVKLACNRHLTACNRHLTACNRHLTEVLKVKVASPSPSPSPSPNTTTLRHEPEDAPA